MAQRMLLSYTISVHLSMPATVHQERGRPCSTTVFFGNGFPSPRVILTPPLRCGIGKKQASRNFRKGTPGKIPGWDFGLRLQAVFSGLDSPAELPKGTPGRLPSPSKPDKGIYSRLGMRYREWL